MAQNREKADWQTIDTNDFAGELDKAYGAYKAAHAAMKSKREHFENMLRAQLPELSEGRRWAVSYNFGNVSVANVPGDARKSNPKAIKLGDLGKPATPAASAPNGQAASGS